MSAIRCCESNCEREVELSCDCTSPATYFCKEHVVNHCRSSGNPHNISSIFVETAEGTKEAILGFLEEEKSKIEEMRASIVSSFTQTLCSYENILKQVLKEIDSESTKIYSYSEKIWKAQKILKIEKDSALNLLALQPNEAVEKAKAIFTAISNNNIGLFCEISRQFDAVIKNFHLERSKVIPHEMNFELKNIQMNFENDGIGNVFYDEKRYEEAPQHFNDAIKICPNSANYYLNKGDALKNLGRREEAMGCYKEAIRIDSNYADAYIAIAAIFHDEKRYEEAVQHYNNAIRINPNSAPYYRNKGNALYELGRREEAIGCYKEAIRLDPNNADAYNVIAAIFHNEKRYEEAVQYLNNAIRIFPNSPLLYYKKGRFLILLGRSRREEAMGCYKEAIRIDPNYADAYILIATIFHDEKRYEEAVQYLNNAIRINPNSAPYYRIKGNVLILLGRREEAIECCKEAIRLDPNNADAYNVIAAIFHDEKRYEEAVKHYNNAIRINPNSALYYRNKGDALTELGRREEAIECYKEAIRLDPNNANHTM